MKRERFGDLYVTGSVFADRNITTLGLGVGEERFTHSDDEHVRLEDVVAGTGCYAALAVELTSLKR